MADWNKVVREGLSLVDLSPAEQKEIIAELAGHLDDLYEQCRRQGTERIPGGPRTRDEIRNRHVSLEPFSGPSTRREI